jgi:DNA-binding transcriptional LysR family regulator
LLRTLRPAFERIDEEIEALSALRDKPAGTIRITTAEHAVNTIIWPVLTKLLPQYPDINVELSIDYHLTDIVAERFDAGIRVGEQVAKDMIAVRIGPDMRMAVVGAPTYFATRKKPRTPQDLATHDCINLRLPSSGGLYAWEFEKAERALNVRVEGHLVLNNIDQMLKAATLGFGLAYVPEDQILTQVAEGRLSRVLADWCPPFPGYHLYYPSRRQPSAAFALLVDALRHRKK